MTGDDVEVICGEWEIGDATMSSSGESYNVIFNVEVGDLVFIQCHNMHRDLLGDQKTS